jgi:peptidoglycan/LPS O-acetylase OafA/YrhL
MMILPNLSFIFYELPYLCSQTWSIGVEEQFYYLWPWLIRANSWKSRLGIIAIFILGTASIFLIYFFFFTNNTIDELPKYVFFFFSQFRIMMMVMGGIGAYLVFTKHSILAFLFQRKVQFVVYGILLTIIISGYEFKE